MDPNAIGYPRPMANGRPPRSAVLPRLAPRAGGLRPAVPNWNDSRAAERIASGDEAAFEELLRQLHGRLIRLALNYVGDRAAAEDVVQETWLAVVTGIHAWEGRASLKAWVFRILVNRAKTRGVRDARFIPFSALEERGSSDPAVDPTRFGDDGAWLHPPGQWADEGADAVLSRREVMAVIERELEALPPNQRIVLTLRDLEGIGSEEVCNILAISETNQRVLLHRARSRVRGALETYYSKE